MILLLALTFSTGVIDAIGFLGLDRVFVGNMTGNVVILGMGLTGAEGLPVLAPTTALCRFFVGAVVAGRLLRGVGTGWSARTSVLLLAVSGLILAGTAPLLYLDELGDWAAPMVTAALGLAMGMQAATARRVAVSDVTTVVVTSTITGLAADSWLGAGTGQPWLRRAGAVVLMGAGALAGALLLMVHITVGLLLSLLLTLTVAAVGERNRRAGRDPRPV